MAVNPSPFGPKPAFFDAAGAPDNTYKLFTYIAGSNTKQNTYTSSTGAVANSNPIILNTLGMTPNEFWFTASALYKVVLAPSTDTDPPSSPIWTIDNLRGINDPVATVTQDEWVQYGAAVTYVSATSFTVAGNATTTFQIGRRVKTTNTGGTVYSTITNSVFGALTTVTVVNDSGVLDSGLSVAYYGLLSVTNPSVPSRLATTSSLTMNTARVLGRTTAATGAIEELTGDQVVGLISTPISQAKGGTGTALATRQLAQIVSTTLSTATTGTTQIPVDDTIPQITEGDLYLTRAITPVSATSTLEIDIEFNCACNAANANMAIALFQDATANAIAARGIINSPNNSLVPLKFTHTMTSGTTSSTSFTVRAGPGGAFTLTVNGTGGTRLYVGVMVSKITIKEYLP